MASASKIAQAATRNAKRAAGAPWAKEKPELLRTHPGWFVAYHEGRRVALEPSIEQLIGALDELLGRPRRPCEYHEIVARPAPRRGPSPRARRGWDAD
jgi:hypothetical protein